MKLKKFFAFSCLLLMFSSLTFTAFGASNSVSLSFNSYEHNQGFVDGSKNGIYYSLANRTHVLYANSKSGSGTLYVSLRRNIAGINPIYGTASVTSAGTYFLNMGPAASDYYIYAYGSNARTNYSLSGEIY